MSDKFPSDSQLVAGSNRSNHYLPFSDTNIVLLFCDVIMFWMASKYRICIADCEFKISEVSFSIFAASTSAFAEMIVASETLFWMAADCRFFLVSSDKIRSLMKMFSMKSPHVLTLCLTYPSMAVATSALLSRSYWNMVSPTTVLMAE